MPNVRFILGRAGSGKTRLILDEIAALLAADPLGEPILVLVPDQATLLYEQMIAAASPTKGYARLCVITFRQLVEMLLREGGGAAIPEVTGLGRRILIGRLLRRLQPQLQFYRSTARQPGLAERIDEAFVELEHSGRTADDLLFLAADIEATSPRSPLPAKLRDLRLVYGAYETLLGNERLDQHRRVRAALDGAARSTTLPRATLFVDAFYDFTRTERQLLVAAARAGCRTTIALTLDPRDASPRRIDEPVGDDHVFRLTTLAFRKLQRAFREAECISTIQTLTPTHRFASHDLLHIDRQMLNARPETSESRGNVRLVEAPSRRAEVDAAARQIIDWLAEGFRLRDILILARDVDPYFRHIEASFVEHGIAFFVDRQQPAMHDPMVRTVRAVMRVALSDFAADGVIELIKAGLVGLGSDDCDAVENYLLAHRIKGGDVWQKPWAFQLRRRTDEGEDLAIREELERINAARAAIVASLQPLRDCEDLDTCTATAWCQRLCESLERLGVNVSLADRIKRAEEAGDLAGAATHREVWNEFGALLDQLANVLGDEPLSLREFAEVVDVALERFLLAIAPPTIDQVLVGSVERTRVGPIKACIVLGLSEGIFPARREEVTALSDDDRRILGARQIELSVSSRTLQLDEQFLAYLALTRASERMTVTRPLVEDDGRALAPSTYWSQLISLFRNALPIETIQCAPRPTCIATASQLVSASIRWSQANAGDLDPAVRQLAAWMHRSSRSSILALRSAVAHGMAYDNDAALSPAVAASLYPSPLRASATRLETFAACPFKHFAQHGLRLAPREEQTITHMDLGIVYHRVLDRLVRRAIDEHREITDPIPDIAARIEQLGNEAAGELRNELLLTPGRNAHLLEGVRRTLGDVVETQRRALALGQFRPRQTEFAFGFDERSAPPLVITTRKRRTVELRGKIDRVDTIALADRLAAVVIDYKLGAQRPDFNRIYYGLSLQLVTYLLVLSAMGEQIEGSPIAPAAALYVKLGRQVESVDHPDDAANPSDDAFFLNGETKARGIIDENFAAALDDTIAPGKYSSAYSIRQAKEPVNLKRNDVLEHTTFRSLVEWARSKIGELADEIVDGRIVVRPYRLRTLTPCPTCSYRPVCRLDLAFNGYKPIRGEGDAKLNAIVEEANQ